MPAFAAHWIVPDAGASVRRIEVREVVEVMDVRRSSMEVESRGNFVELRFAIPSAESKVALAVETVRKAVQLLAPAEEHLFRLELALQEALLNGHFHGNQENSTRDIRVALAVSPKKIELQVEDDGTGYELNEDFFMADAPEQRGRGLYLIRQLMDSVTVTNHGTQIMMWLARE
jgi:anti-sigma regulatory factor (Ser/Thr protein kinase)